MKPDQPKGIDFMKTEPTNADRAQWAHEALAVFTARTFSGDHPDTMARDDLECAISDLICDLLHFALQQGFDTGSIVQRACGHFGCELWEEAQLSVDDPCLAGAAPDLLDALNDLLQQTVVMDLQYGIALTEGEQEARAKALIAIAKARGVRP